MTTTIIDRKFNLPITGDTFTRDARLAEIATWSGLQRWYSPESYETGVLYDRLAGRENGVPMAQAFKATAPSISTIGGNDWLNMAGTTRLTPPVQTEVVDVSGAFSIAMTWHPNGDTGNGFLFSTPAGSMLGALGVIPTGERFLSLSSYHTAGNIFFILTAEAASDTTIINTGSGGALTVPNNAAVLIILSYSAANGWKLYLKSASGTTGSKTLASPTTAQTVNKGGIQLGAFKTSNGASTNDNGALGDLFIFNLDLHDAANASLLAAVNADLTDTWL